MSQAIKKMFCPMCQKTVRVESKSKGLGDHIIKYHPETQKKMFRSSNTTPSQSRVDQLNAELLSRDMSEISITPDNNTAQPSNSRNEITKSDIQLL